jgi:hypothetical protein
MANCVVLVSWFLPGMSNNIANLTFWHYQSNTTELERYLQVVKAGGECGRN